LKAKAIGYWVATVLVALVMLAGGGTQLARRPEALQGMAHLGYPLYFSLILGAWKVLGAVAILAPRFPRLKEWAYAGIFFDLTGASLSHIASGDGASDIIGPLVFVGILVASWALRPASRTVGSGR
jgi:uncharacterized membrane protein YphA (DoxX/SURF4 family)